MNCSCQLLKNMTLVAMTTLGTLAAYTQSLSPTFDIDYTELTDNKPHDGNEVWGNLPNAPQLSWGSIDVKYPKHDVPQLKIERNEALSAWKGEKVQAQALLWTKEKLAGVTLKMSDLKQGTNVIPSSAISTHFVRYVMADPMNEGGGGCGHRDNKADWDSIMVADVLDIKTLHDVEAQSVQPIWVKVSVPRDAKAGKYKGTLTVQGKNFKPMSLKLELTVVNRVLPEPKDWALNLDFWQNPYAVARYYNVPLWSREHFDLMLPYMKMLADIGQRSITATIMHKPWNAQTEDYFDSMITRIKNIDGTWTFDYTVFDRWVEFMMNEAGIDELISCYTMIPWNLSFDYYDQATNRVKFVNAKPGDQAYAEYWGEFLKDFSRHLREKGWMEKTAISMDERPLDAMREAIKVIKEADPEFKITLAGNYHPEIQEDLYYLSIPYGNKFPADVLQQRRDKGQISTVYTCCTEGFPNIFTISEPAEAAWTPLHAMAADYDGYLRWSVIAWTADPLRDSRFRLFAAGDTYSIYPGPRSSIRFERFAQGMQMAEKANVLRKEFEAKGQTNKLEKLNEALMLFTPQGMVESGLDAAESVEMLNKLLNSL